MSHSADSGMSVKRRHKNVVIGLGLAVLTAIVSGSLVQLAEGAPVAPVATMAAATQTAVARLPLAKRALAERDAQRIASAATARALGTPTATRLSTPAPLRRGIVESNPPMGDKDFHMTNSWQDVINGKWVHIYAGGLVADPSQGVVEVSRENQARSVIDPVASRAAGHLVSAGPPDVQGRFFTPNRDGAVRLVAEQGLQFTLQSTSGAHTVFDLASGTFHTP